jgi:cobalt-zinc-cadmium efflux system outer membrane protein
MSGKVLALGAALIVLMCGVAWSQPADRLSLQMALDLAAKQNLDLLSERQRQAVSKAGVQIARQRPNPILNFTALRDEPHEGVFVDQPLELGGQRGRRIELAHQEGVLTDLEIAALERQIRRQTREAYFQLSFSRAESQRLEHVLELAKRLEQIARDRFNAGDVAQLEVIQAGLDVARAQADFKVAQQEEKISLSQLNALLDEPATTNWETGEALEDLPPAVSLPELIQLAYYSNPDLRHVVQEEKVEESRRELLKAERIPNFDFEFGLDFNAPRDFQTGPRGQISVPLPIFARNEGEIAQSLATQNLLGSEQFALKRSVAARVETAYFDLDAQRTQADIYRTSLMPVAQQLESLAEESYRAGKADILMVLTAQHNVQDVEQKYLQSLLTVQTSFAGLEDIVGTSIDPK